MPISLKWKWVFASCFISAFCKKYLDNKNSKKAYSITILKKNWLPGYSTEAVFHNGCLIFQIIFINGVKKSYYKKYHYQRFFKTFSLNFLIFFKFRDWQSNLA